MKAEAFIGKNALFETKSSPTHNKVFSKKKKLLIRQKPQLMQTRGTQGKKETRLANSPLTLSPPQDIKRGSNNTSLVPSV